VKLLAVWRASFSQRRLGKSLEPTSPITCGRSNAVYCLCFSALRPLSARSLVLASCLPFRGSRLYLPVARFPLPSRTFVPSYLRTLSDSAPATCQLFPAPCPLPAGSWIERIRLHSVLARPTNGQEFETSLEEFKH
jgi:hypothetical protein